MPVQKYVIIILFITYIDILYKNIFFILNVKIILIDIEKIKKLYLLKNMLA